jgi:hypothetical protein
MAISVIIGILILGVIIYTMLKIVKNVVVGIVLIFFALVAGYLILGSIPSPRSIPVIGPLFPEIPSEPLSIISYVKKIFRNIEIADVSRDDENNLLITVVNAGKLQVSNFTVYVDDKKTNIINKPEDPLKPSQITVIQTDWAKDFMKILVQTSNINATYSKSD